MKSKQCKDCGEVYPETREFFGQYRNVRKDGTIKIAHRNSCRKCMATNTKKYDSENPDNVLERQIRRENRVKASGGSYTQSDISQIRKKLDDRCRFCGISLNNGGHIEHLTPISRGGTSNKNNLTLSCYKCNMEKTNKTLDEYIHWRQERELVIRNISYSESPDTPTIARGRKSYK